MKKLLISMMLALPIFFMTSCSSDDDGGSNPPAEISETYQLRSVADPNISGTAKFIKNTDNSVTIELQLMGTPAGGMHPAHIHDGTAVEGPGAIALTLGTVDGDTGFSTITTTTLDDDSAITYEQLLDFDGYINVHLSADELTTLVAQGDIGQNELTGASVTYDLGETGTPTIFGTVTFEERVNGNALATISLAGTPNGGVHPAHIHSGSVANPDPSPNIIFTFNPVMGPSGLSMTNISELMDGTPFGYDDVSTVDGYVNVHVSIDDLETLIAQGNIGANAE